jgi:hypothetical protein
MARSRRSTSLLLVGALAALAAGGPAPTPGEPEDAPFDPRSGAVSSTFEDPFANGAVPDLLILASADARGETIPCG